MIGKIRKIFYRKKHNTLVEQYSINDLYYIEPGDMGGCNGDKKHCCFHLKHNYGLNWGLKQK